MTNDLFIVMETDEFKELVNDISAEFQIILDSCEEQLNVIKHFIVEQSDQISQSVLTDFDRILDIAFDEISDINKTNKMKVNTVCIRMISRSLIDFVKQEGEYIVDNSAEHCDELTDFVLSEKNKIMEFAEKHCEDLTSRSDSLNIYSNHDTKSDFIFEESIHVLTSVSKKYELIIEFLQSECREIDQLSYRQYEESLKLLQEECMLLNNGCIQ